MEKNTRIWLGVLLGLLVVIVILQVVQISALSSVDLSATVEQIARVGVNPSAGAMVGGC